MHHYQFNIGDYKKDTAHLSLLEHGIYRMLIDSYYTNEGPIPADDAKLMRTHCVRTADEQQAYKNIVEDFFELRDGAYFHAGCEKVLARIYEKSTKAKESAEKRWASKNKGSRAEKCEEDANGMRTHSEGNANGMLPNNPIPITHNTDPIGSVAGNISPAPCPHQEIISLYHEIIPAGTAVRVWNSEREKHLRARWRENPKRQNLEWWRKFFEYAAQSEFLTGQTAPAQPGRDPFVVSLDWLINPQNFAKVIEGKYHQRGAA